MAVADTPHLLLNAPACGEPARLSGPVGPRPARAVRVRLPRAVLRADAQGPRPRARHARSDERRRGARTAARRPARSCSRRARIPTGPSARARGWRCNRSHGMRWTVGAAARAAYRPSPSVPRRWLFARLPEWEETPERPQPAQVALGETKCVARLDGTDRPRAPNAATASAPTPATRPRRSPRAATAACRTCCSRRPAPGSARPSAISPPPRCGPRRVRRHGVGVDLHQEPPAPAAPASWRAWPADACRRARSRWSCARAARTICACSTSRTRCRAASAGARRSSRSWLRAGPRISRDGDVVGGDLPGWLGTLFRSRAIRSLTDQRGECIYAGCPHYRKCFIERAARASARRPTW